MMTFARCFAEEQCPYFDALGAYLGKPKGEFDALGAFCPDWQEWWEKSLEGNIRPGTTPEDIAYIKGVPDRMLRKGLGSSCEEWRRRTRILLHDQEVPRELPALDVRLRLRDGGQGIVSEATVRVGRHNVWALLDTGATQLFLGGEPGDAAAWGLSELVATSKVWTSTGFVSAPDVRLQSVYLDGVPFVSQVTASLKPSHFPAGIGMNMLMHYDAVCFDWQNQRLLLGRLGPCAQRHRARNAIISPGFLPYVQATTTNGSRPTRTSNAPPSSTTPSGWPPLSSSAWMLVDTGAAENHCSDAFAESVAEDGRFSFGDGLTAGCSNVGNTLFDHPNYGLSGILGMETLLEFDAFGWELDPFRIYFVPRADNDQNERRNGER